MRKNISSQAFARSSEGLYAFNELTLMEADSSYKTDPTFSPLSENGQKSFSEKHMEYLCKYKNVNSLQYISNLKLMTNTGIVESVS